MRKFFKALLILIAIAIYIFSVNLVVVPYVKIEMQDKNAKTDAKDFISSYESLRTEWESFEETYKMQNPDADQDIKSSIEKADDKIKYSRLLKDMQIYNESIFKSRQDGLVDPFSYEKDSFDLTQYGIEDEIVGTLDIPKIGTFPIYLGASKDHMANGVAQLTETSMPIGGINTNCVIAGHRGWNNGKFLKDIEEVVVGDTITVTNLWYEMKYIIKEIKIIMPNDVEKILIAPGKDILTVLTCHPYGTGGRYRYLLICERTDKTLSGSTVEGVPGAPDAQNGEIVETLKDGEIPYFSSQNEILWDDWLHYIGFGMMLFVPFLLIVVSIHRSRKRKKKRKKKELEKQREKERKEREEIEEQK